MTRIAEHYIAEFATGLVSEIVFSPHPYATPYSPA